MTTMPASLRHALRRLYRLSPAGKRQLLTAEQQWRRIPGAVARVIWPIEEH
jgi:hypothetical protein